VTPSSGGGGMPHLFCFGLGYSANQLAGRLMGEGWMVSGTCRGDDKRRILETEGIRAFLFDRGRPLDDPEKALADVTDLLISIPPDVEGDPVLDQHGELIARLMGIRWVGYLSTTGVYGDTGGAVVDESAPLNPSSERSRRRVAAERQWLELGATCGLPLHVFRLAGIYGPGRSTLDQVRNGRARRIDRPGHRFSRIHVDDIAGVVRASMARPEAGTIYNVSDDRPAEPADVVAFACRLLNVTPPPLVPFEEAAAAMSPMALSFWRDNRRVDNRRIKRDLGVRLAYPDFETGLRAVLEAERGEAGERPVATAD